MKKALLALAVAALASVAPGQRRVASSFFVEQAKLTASDGAASDQFGNSVSISGRRALVGSWRDDDNGPNSGAAYLFVHTAAGWSEEAKLLPSPDGAVTAFFGASVSLSGDRALVGAEGDFFEEGRAYVFVRSGASWTQEAVLTASDGTPDNTFGASVSLDGDTALVGAWIIDSAYVFVRRGTVWIEQAKLKASPPSDYMGDSVSLSGDTALVGAPNDDVNGTDSGSAHVFVRSGTIWTEEAKLMASNGAQQDQFGSSVSLSGNRALVGAPGEFVNNVEGQAYVFVRSAAGWTEDANLTASDGAPQDLFGLAVSLSGDAALVGSILDDDNGTDSGSAYVFVRDRTSWIEEGKLTASGGVAGDRFGSSVSISGHLALVGAELDDDNGSGSGAAYVFAVPEPLVYCTAGVSSSGCQASIGSAGVPSATASSGFSLIAAGVEGVKDGLFFFGSNGQQANSWGNSTSFQCVVPPVIRTGLLSGTGTAGSCDGGFSLDLNAVWTNQPSKNPGAAAVVQAQLWYRDPLSTSNQTTSLSDAVEFTVAP